MPHKLRNNVGKRGASVRHGISSIIFAMSFQNQRVEWDLSLIDINNKISHIFARKPHRILSKIC